MSPHRGTKTTSAGAVAATSFGTAFIDPTGISLATFLTSSTAALAGATYHTAKKISKHSSKAMEENREKKAGTRAVALNMTPQQHVQFQHSVENTLRRLVAATQGAAVSGILFIGLPYMGVVWAINAAETVYQIKRLKMLASRAGGTRALVKAISKRNAVTQVAAGGIIKTATLSVTLGHDVDAAVQGMAGHVDNTGSKEMLTYVGDHHEAWLEKPGVQAPTDLVDQPQNAMKEILEQMEGDFDGDTQDWNWSEGHPVGSDAALGVVVAAVNKAVDVAVDGPLHKGADRVGGSTVTRTARS